MARPRLLHLFNAFQVGGVERQHMMQVERFIEKYDQQCWAYIEGPLQGELDAIGVAYTVGDAATGLAMACDADCILIRTNRYFRQMVEPLSRLKVPILYIRDYLSWYQGNGTYHDRELDRQAYALADHTLFCGPSLKKAAGGLPVRGGEYLYNALDLNVFPMQPRTEPGRTPIRVGMLGNLVPRKNQAEAIRALRRQLTAGICELHIGGDFRHPKFVAEVKGEAEGLPVFLHGHVADPIEFLSNIDVFLMASTKEGWPVSIMEAMACGVPVMSTDIGDISTLLGNGDTGILLEGMDDIPAALEALRNAETYTSFSSKGVAQVAYCSADEAARKVDEILTSLLAERGA